MDIKAWIAENRGKNRNGYELVLICKKTKNSPEWVFLKRISRGDVRKLEKIGIMIEEG